MKKKKAPISDAEYYDKHGILGDIIDEDVHITLDEALREAILHKKRTRPMKNISIKMDPFMLQAIKKIALQEGLPYQNLIRHWITKEMKEALHIGS